ncbi:MAG: four helix bundle protein [Sphingobacteriales bacterium]|nr:MAG: four helix bundle protein [Sphingobacteriales bacterium]
MFACFREFTDLQLWKENRTLINQVWDLVKQFPPEEKFRLSDQLIRSSRSINASLSEGHGRYTFRDQLHFCIISRGSLSETLNHLVDAYDCNYISADKLSELKQRIDISGKLLNSYIGYLRKQIKSSK